ncbi:hypothetical protein ACFYRN_22915 [Streptomyces sp. NPDC005227]|uniref:hypothetical protein n=1 Tax=Streptomyces sp. NPDC005227 TaxID=3364707 RepID=UPI0036C10306
MRIRPVLAVPAVAAALLLAASASTAVAAPSSPAGAPSPKAAAPAKCTAKALSLRAERSSDDPSLVGRSFTARELGAGATVRVWEPVTTWWKPSVAAADRALGLR